MRFLSACFSPINHFFIVNGRKLNYILGISLLCVLPYSYAQNDINSIEDLEALYPTSEQIYGKQNNQDPYANYYQTQEPKAISEYEGNDELNLDENNVGQNSSTYNYNNETVTSVEIQKEVQDTHEIIEEQEQEQEATPLQENQTNAFLNNKNQTLKENKGPLSQGLNTTAGMAQWLVSTLVILAIIFILAFLIKKSRLVQRGIGTLKLESQVALGPKERLVKIDAEGRKLLIGVTSANVSFIADLTKEKSVDKSEDNKNSQTLLVDNKKDIEVKTQHNPPVFAKSNLNSAFIDDYVVYFNDQKDQHVNHKESLKHRAHFHHHKSHLKGERAEDIVDLKDEEFESIFAREYARAKAQGEHLANLPEDLDNIAKNLDKEFANIKIEDIEVQAQKTDQNTEEKELVVDDIEIVDQVDIVKNDNINNIDNVVDANVVDYKDDEATDNLSSLEGTSIEAQAQAQADAQDASADNNKQDANIKDDRASLESTNIEAHIVASEAKAQAEAQEASADNSKQDANIKDDRASLESTNIEAHAVASEAHHAQADAQDASVDNSKQDANIKDDRASLEGSNIEAHNDMQKYASNDKFGAAIIGEMEAIKNLASIADADSSYQSKEVPLSALEPPFIEKKVDAHIYTQNLRADNLQDVSSADIHAQVALKDAWQKSANANVDNLNALSKSADK